MRTIVDRLKTEFGESFLINALYIGELIGYKIQSWEQFDQRIDIWTETLHISRAAVSQEWSTLWNEINLRHSADDRAAAWNRAINWWTSPCSSNSQCDPVNVNRQPTSQVNIGASDTKFSPLTNADVALDNEWITI